MKKKKALGYTALALLVIDLLALANDNRKLTQQVKIQDKKIDTYFGGVVVLSKYVPSEKYHEVLMELNADPILNYHST